MDIEPSGHMLNPSAGDVETSLGLDMPDLFRLLDEISGWRHVSHGVDARIEADGLRQSPLALPVPDHVGKSPARVTGVSNVDLVPSKAIHRFGSSVST